MSDFAKHDEIRIVLRSDTAPELDIYIDQWQDDTDSTSVQIGTRENPTAIVVDLADVRRLADALNRYYSLNCNRIPSVAGGLLASSDAGRLTPKFVTQLIQPRTVALLKR